MPHHNNQAEVCDMQIYVRTTLSMRESLAEWRSVLQNIMESSPTATQMLLYTLATTDMQLLEDTLICAQVASFHNCPVYFRTALAA